MTMVSAQVASSSIAVIILGIFNRRHLPPTLTETDTVILKALMGIHYVGY